MAALNLRPPAGAGEAPDRREPRLWVFNLDAELELAREGPYETPKRVMQALSGPLEAARRLMSPGDAVLGDAPAKEAAPSHATRAADRPPTVGRCWCPTPSARARLRKLGVTPEATPEVDIVRRVNHRRFALELGGGAPGARYVETEAELRAVLTACTVGVWLFKRPFSFAGRGQRRIAGSPSRDDRRWLQDSLRASGMLAEPWLELSRELALHGYIHQDGRVELGRPTLQRTDAHRAWTSSEPLPPGELAPDDLQRLYAAAEATAEALRNAGYFGPLGIDAYQFRTETGALRLNPLSELNARFSMGYAVGMAHALARI